MMQAVVFYEKHEPPFVLKVLQLKVVVVMDFLMNGWYNILYVDSLMCLF